MIRVGNLAIVEWKDPTWFRTFRGFCISWWIVPKKRRYSPYYPYNTFTLFGLSIKWGYGKDGVYK